MVFTTNSLSIASRGFLASANSTVSSGNLFELTGEVGSINRDPINNDITIVRKTTINPRVSVFRKDTMAVYDLTGFTMTMCVKRNPVDTDANALIATQTATIANPSIGVGVFTFSTSLTNIPGGEYWYDVRISDGTNQYVVVGPSRFIVKEHVTSR